MAEQLDARAARHQIDEEGEVRVVAERDELDVLATLVEAYERDHFPIESPDPVSAILFRMEQMGLDRKALEPFLGSRSRVSEVLNGKRGLSINQIRKLHDGLNIPLENLIGAG